MSLQDVPKSYISIYCLTPLTPTEQSSYTDAIKDASDFLDFAEVSFIPWTGSRDGDLQDMYRFWRETGGSKHNMHFTFYIDRAGLADQSLIVAQGGGETPMLFNEDTYKWAGGLLRSYVGEHKDLAEYYGDAEDATSVNKEVMEEIQHELWGKKYLAYGRISAEIVCSAWANLDVSNMSLDEVVGLSDRENGEDDGQVKMVMNELWNKRDDRAFAERLEHVVRGSREEARAKREESSISTIKLRSNKTVYKVS